MWTRTPACWPPRQTAGVNMAAYTPCTLGGLCPGPGRPVSWQSCPFERARRDSRAIRWMRRGGGGWRVPSPAAGDAAVGLAPATLAEAIERCRFALQFVPSACGSENRQVLKCILATTAQRPGVPAPPVSRQAGWHPPQSSATSCCCQPPPCGMPPPVGCHLPQKSPPWSPRR